MGAMRVVGIDPGLQRTGYAVLHAVADHPSRTPALHEAGVFRFKPARTVAERLVELEQDLTALLARAEASVVCVEKLYAHYNHPTTAIVMGHARGVILLVAQRMGLRLIELPSTEVKRAVTGNGHASKEQVQSTVQALLALPAPPSPTDVSDAIAIALTGVQRAASVPVSSGACRVPSRAAEPRF